MRSVGEESGVAEETARKPKVFQLRSCDDWTQWAQNMAEGEGFSMAVLVARALRDYARANGYPDPPMRSHR